MLRIIKGLMFVIILLSIYLVGRILISSINDFYYLHIYDNSAQISEYYEEEKTRLYNECLMASYNESDDTEYLEAAEDNLTSFLNDYNASISFKDVNTGYAYEYNSDRQYYAASTIKMLDAIYIYIYAYNNKIDLDSEVTYLARNKRAWSFKMQNYKIGDKVSLRKLVEYAITVSDNIAHDMLVDYIGKSTLKEFGNSLGATTTLVGNDDFGAINNRDSMIYLETLNDLINNTGELGEELKTYFVNSDQNYLNFPNEGISAVQKYGEYNSYYHANGIVYAENPYLVSILTLHGYDDFEKVIRNINTEIYNLQKEFYENRQNVCYNKVYGENSL